MVEVPYQRIVVLGLVLCVTPAGCMSRAIKEGAGVITGASGKIAHLKNLSGLSDYRGLQVELITSAEGLDVPGDMASLISEAFTEAAEELELKADGTPGLLVQGEIIHFESGGIVDAAIGPLQEVIVRTQLSDGETGEVLGIANLIGRSKTTTASGKRNLAKGSAKALKKWLKKSGLGRNDKDE